MNKNTVIGLTLIGLLLVLFSVYNSRLAREQQEYKRVQDSIAMVRAAEYAEEMAKNMAAQREAGADGETVNAEAAKGGYTSTYSNAYLEAAYTGEVADEFRYLENDKLRIKYSTRGAQAVEVLVKDYQTADSTDLYLMKEGGSEFGLQLYTGQYINTEDFTFRTVYADDSTLTMRLPFSESAYIDYTYRLSEGSYLVDFNVNMVGMEKFIPRNASGFEVVWNMDIPRLERGFKNEKMYSTVAYKFPGEKEVEDLGLRKESAEKNITTKVEWFGFQQQFFSAILRSESNFEGGDLTMKFYPETDPDKNLMHCTSSMAVQYDTGADVNIPMQFYYGPNHFRTLKSYGYNFEEIVPLGGWIVRWINVGVIIPIFDLFSKFIKSYGLIILLLTLLIKLVISPLTIKSYMSSAKMNVLRPEIEKINAKYPKQEDAMKKQQETMALYNKAGVSMFGGCLPMLLQFPVLFAMFRFFPASFELRQQSFLWADDLSTYDSIVNFGFSIPLLGDHVSLFALLCAVTMFFSAKFTQGQQMSSDPNMKSMRFMTLYFMPVFMFFICNNLSSGLTYYYFLSNLIMIIQTWVIRRYFVDEKKIMEKVRLASVKGATKPKSKFQQRLEAIQKAQEQAMREQQKNRK